MLVLFYKYSYVVMTVLTGMGEGNYVEVSCARRSLF